VDAIARMASEPSFDFGMLVSCVVVSDQVQFKIGRNVSGVDPFRWTVLGIKEEGVPNAKKSSTVCT
jgi:hypothetical protein